MRASALLLVIGLTSSCSKLGSHDKHASEPIARVGGKTITAADLEARVAEQPSFSRARYQSLDRKKELLDGMIKTQLLVDEARRRHLDQDPEVRATIEQVLVQKLTRVVSDESGEATDAELRRYYDDHRAEFGAPTRVHVAHVFLAAPEKDARRPRAAAEAATLLQRAKAREAKGEKQALQIIASERSDDAATKAAGGDLGFRTKEELARAWGAEFADAVLALKTANEIGPVISTPKGLHLVKLLGRHDGYEISFEAAKSRIAGRLGSERRARTIDELVGGLKKKSKIEVNEQALAHVDLAAPREPHANVVGAK